MRFTILGCGSSMGVPRPDGNFGNCNPNNKKNIRTRCSAVIQGKSLNIIIDTSPDMRQQLINNKITNIDKVLFSHMHADQTHGINDLRYFYLKTKVQIPVFANKSTTNYLLKSFKYCFKKTNDFYPPIMKLKNLKKKHNFLKSKIKITSFEVEHGSINSLCYIVNDKLAYASDVSSINKNNYQNISQLKYFVVDCLREEPHPSHYNLKKVLDLIKEIKPKYTILTNLHSSLDYTMLKKKLPKGVFPAYDGMKLFIN